MVEAFQSFHVNIATIFLVYVLFVYIWIILVNNGILDLKLLLGIGILSMLGCFIFKYLLVGL